MARRVERLAADALNVIVDGLIARVRALRIRGRCLRLLVVLLCLRDFLAARAIVELFDRALLAADVGLHLCNRELELAPIEACEHLPFLHGIALIDEDFRNAVAATERERHLAHIDVARKRQHLRRLCRLRGLIALIAKHARCNREYEDDDGCTFLSKLLHPAHLLKNCCTFRLL